MVTESGVIGQWSSEYTLKGIAMYEERWKVGESAAGCGKKLRSGIKGRCIGVKGRRRSFKGQR